MYIQDKLSLILYYFTPNDPLYVKGWQLGRQPQKVSAAYGDKKAVLQELPGKFGGVMVAAVHPSGWPLVVIFAEKPARDLKEETHQSIRQTRQELSHILTQ